ncbi:hypothetical protein CRG98_028727 [Punica granatum]|uniref:Uncharacterized protein n=1 Tax=Punica granatum TaxID=22663 RepID=A0A2I0J3U2_PUNGR|nr:hypothetical protein CRG98_028727 [Punica granatum]
MAFPTPIEHLFNGHGVAGHHIDVAWPGDSITASYGGNRGWESHQSRLHHCPPFMDSTSSYEIAQVQTTLGHLQGAGHIQLHYNAPSEADLWTSRTPDFGIT